MPVVPAAARTGSINVNSIIGGQADTVDAPVETAQTPCVADRASAVFDRRFLVEERFEDVRREVTALLDDLVKEDGDRQYQLDDVMTVLPTRTPADSPLLTSLNDAIREVVGRPATLVASPGTYDQKHVARIAGVQHCVAYGPGELVQAHQPDESCALDDIVTSAKVMALAALDLLQS